MQQSAEKFPLMGSICLQDSSWNQKGSDILAEYNWKLGRSVSLSEDGWKSFVTIVSPGASYGEGKVQVYTMTNPYGQYEISGGDIDGPELVYDMLDHNYFRRLVSLSYYRNRLAIGSPGGSASVCICANGENGFQSFGFWKFCFDVKRWE